MIVSLYQGLNLSFSVLNILLGVSNFSFSACVSISNNCNPFLPIQFLINIVFSISDITYYLKTLYSSIWSSLACCIYLHVPIKCGLLHHWSYFGSHALSCTNLLTCHLFSLSDCFCTSDFESAFVRLPCSIILLCWDCLFWGISNVCCLCLPIWDFLLLMPYCAPCLIEGNADVWLYAYFITVCKWM